MRLRSRSRASQTGHFIRNYMFSPNSYPRQGRSKQAMCGGTPGPAITGKLVTRMSSLPPRSCWQPLLGPNAPGAAGFTTCTHAPGTEVRGLLPPIWRRSQPGRRHACARVSYLSRNLVTRLAKRHRLIQLRPWPSHTASSRARRHESSDGTGSAAPACSRARASGSLATRC